MKLLILQGPNLNLLGLKSSELDERITLDKLNRAIKKYIQLKDVEVKILQTHKSFQAINFIQRNRNWADGLILTPTSWAKYEWTLVETISLVKLKTVQVIFDEKYSFSISQQNSIFDSIVTHTEIGRPKKAHLQAIDFFIK
ncbi:MAG: type II 3-dehydroquinate dehydratase [Candidatus Marinimicrobia bacterium]|jgi:3-dehydroquinate dehydratase-2|nr:type II 3-dehydroquinate dehydratase [Candidatus Neomarinimicrobiota bacterium]MBT3495595.1 type II 3-dehydroquinate dehydratase [Candidatus Neomarinimicrobiota bacterium]MBT4144598.1 type II 3-dehydroquinate dehydratase [Candidatus Neomarinimicrobiota bacterium]MBT4990757.1 type II 3-dehydroquinate dehydratase [Candidatus Neomarinimicrobiota bacterium]MBT6159567.1 type II 3-dehydroquinate dehydratase [Candidatus Neomarinimicrobiota bacterium]